MSDVKFSLIDLGNTDLGKFAETATALVHRIADHFERKHAPDLTRRQADAARYAEYEQAVSRVEANDIEHRARLWAESDAVRHQKNMEMVTQKALPDVKDGATPEAIEADWLDFYFSKARLVSDEKMQSIWAAVLAGEANKPGRFRKRTIEAVSLLERADAEQFTQLCSFLWRIGDQWCPLVYDVGAPVYTTRGVHLASLEHLRTNGLINYESVGTRTSHGVPREGRMVYGGRVVVLRHSSESQSFNVGHVTLTQVGQELAPLAGGVPSDEYLKYCLDQFMAQGFFVQVEN